MIFVWLSFSHATDGCRHAQDSMHHRTHGGPTTVPTMFGCLVEWLTNCLAIWMLTSTNLATLGPKINAIGASQEASWSGLGESWPQDSPKTSKSSRSKRLISRFWCKPGVQKVIKISLKSNPQRYHCFCSFFGSTFGASWCQLGSYWTPNPSQNGANVAPKSMQSVLSSLNLFVKRSWPNFIECFLQHCKAVVVLIVVAICS